MEKPGNGRLARRLGLGDAVVIGMGAMIGAGIFAAPAPAAAAAGPALPVALAVAGAVAWCNAVSSARLAGRYPVAGGTYVYARERLGPFWGHLAGWGFTVGKTASCAAMALTAGSYLWPRHASAVAVAAVVALTALNYVGVRKSAWLTRALLAAVLAVLAAVVVATLTSGTVRADRVAPGFEGGLVDGLGGVLQAAGLLFFAFAGYARITLLGEEVRDPARTIRRAMQLALGGTLVLYTLVTVAVLSVLGPDALAAAEAPVADAVAAAGRDRLVPVVRAGAALAALGALLALVLGVSRMVLAMSRDRRLPVALAAVHPRFGTPHRAELLVGVVVAVLAATVDLREAIGFSSFAVLVYYALTHLSAWRLRRPEGRPPRWTMALGLAGCLAMAASLPPASVLSGTGVLAAGALLYLVRARRARARADGVERSAS